jgi:hypothetical protein
VQGKVYPLSTSLHAPAPNAYPNIPTNHFMPSFTKRSAWIDLSVKPERETLGSSTKRQVPTEEIGLLQVLRLCSKGEQEVSGDLKAKPTTRHAWGDL